jgi:CheY-like chemotaxis protein
MSSVDSFYKRRAIGLHGKRIVILDDIPEIAALFKRALELSGLEVVVVAHSGEEMLEKLRKVEVGKIDFALIDYNLKGSQMNGMQIALQVRRKNPNIIAIVVSADDSVEAEARANGFCFLKKPVGLTELLDILE